MLTALEQGVKGGKWYSLIDKVQSETTLKAAFSCSRLFRRFQLLNLAQKTVSGGSVTLEDFLLFRSAWPLLPLVRPRKRAYVTRDLTCGP
jgi:hypothetical protein